MPSPQVWASMEKHYKKEFIIEMQAKGKLPKFVNEATERRDETFRDSTKRIFPPAGGGIDAVLETMLAETSKRIEAAGPPAKEGAPHERPPRVDDRIGAVPAAPRAKATPEEKAKHARRQELKAKISHLENELKAERTLRMQLEEHVHMARKNMN